MNEPLQITNIVLIPAQDLEWSSARASGPGGQNVNKVSSKIELWFDLANNSTLPEDVKQRLKTIVGSRLTIDGRILVKSQKTRDQARNLEDARDKLKELIIEAFRVPKTRRPTRPSKRAKARRLDAKRIRGAAKRERRGKPSADED